jgi:hypothetical protein
LIFVSVTVSSHLSLADFKHPPCQQPHPNRIRNYRFPAPKAISALDSCPNATLPQTRIDPPNSASSLHIQTYF